MHYFTVKAKKSKLCGYPIGWGNGYVIVPKGHRIYGIDLLGDTDIHGGITLCEELNEPWIKALNVSPKYTGWWVFGFDTRHYGDSKRSWPRSKVRKETLRLKNILLTLCDTLSE